MKNALFILIILFVSTSFAQQNQTILKSDIEIGDGYMLTTFLKVDQANDQIIFSSPKNADARLFGGFKARLGRMLGKSPKKGILLTIDSKQTGDSLKGTIKLPVFGKLKFKGQYKNGILTGEMIKNDTVHIGNIKGIQSQEESIDYSCLFPKIIEITENNIYSKSVLQTDTWKKYQKQLKKMLNNVQDDIELFIGFNTLSPKPPFSHYDLLLLETKEEDNSTENPEKREATVIYEKKNESTGYLKIKNFSTSKKELSDILPRVVNENPEYLIIDLQDNSGGGVEAAFEFAKYITGSSIEIGYFVTNKLQYADFDIELFNELPIAEPQTTNEFIETLKNGKGAKLMFTNSGTPVYNGNIFILTNGNTASTCEPIVYVLKESKRATIIGEKTAGAMLSATYFDISGKYKLVLPIADFYTHDGVRLDRTGVTPNIETTSENALDKALSLINNQE